MATENIRIVISQEGGERTARVIRGVGQSALYSQPAVISLKNAILAVASIEFGRKIIEFGDQLLTMRNRIGFVTKSTEEAVEVFDRLQAIANETRGHLSSTTDLYTRLALATKNLGLTQEQTLATTKALNQAVVLSGANTREADAAILQLSQGLSSDRLAGDELRSVLEQLPLVADIIGKELGVTRGALRFLAKEGEISAEIVVRAFQKGLTS